MLDDEVDSDMVWPIAFRYIVVSFSTQFICWSGWADFDFIIFIIVFTTVVCGVFVFIRAKGLGGTRFIPKHGV